MAEAKTQPTNASVDDFLEQITDEERRADCRTIVRMMTKASGRKPVMWGSAIIGFGTYRYTYASGKTGDWPIIGFSPRKNDLTLYLKQDTTEFPALLGKLGKHKSSKACLYVKRLRDVDTAVLEEMIRLSVDGMQAQRID